MIFADLKAIKQILDSVEEIESGPVSIEISGPIRILVKASDGKPILDTEIKINMEEKT